MVSNMVVDFNTTLVLFIRVAYWPLVHLCNFNTTLVLFIQFSVIRLLPLSKFQYNSCSVYPTFLRHFLFLL